MDLKNPRSNQGMALLMALFFIGIAVLIVGMLMTRTMQQRKSVARYEDYNNSFLGLEAAISKSRVELENGEDGIIGMENWEPKWSEDNKLLLPEFGDAGVEAQTLQSMDDVEYASYTIAWADDGQDNNGDGLIDDINEEWMYTVYGMAKRARSRGRWRWCIKATMSMCGKTPFSRVQALWVGSSMAVSTPGARSICWATVCLMGWSVWRPWV